MADYKLNLTAVQQRGQNGTKLSEQEETLFQVLHDTVQPGNAITAQNAADTIDGYLRNLPERSKEKKEDIQAVENFLHSFWSLVIAVVESTPFDHPGQERLVAVLQALVEKSEGSYEIWGQSALQVWSDLPLLGPVMRENWNPSWTENLTTTADSYRDIPGAKEWININSFAALLLGVELVNWETYPIWSLRDAFEEPFRSKVENDIHALVATQWIAHAGQLLHDLSIEGSTVENPRITKGGSLFKGESGFNVERWEFWKKRAGELSEEVSEEVKRVAKSVVLKMVGIEMKK